MPDRRPAPRPARRGVLRAAIVVPAAALIPGLTGCGRVRLGQPEAYTPPPPGIDDLYRPDLIDALDQLISGIRAITPPDPLRELFAALRSALPQQRAALLTGAEAEEEAEQLGSDATSAPASGTASPTPVPGAPTDVASLLAALVSTRDLAADACIQCSGSLARVTGAIGAYLTWAGGRIVQLAGDPALSVPAPPTADQLTPTREVPRVDPPSVGARSDYQTYLTRTQSDEWFAGYVDEVLAARTDDRAARERLLTASTAHRDAAQALTAVAEKDGLTWVAEEPVYPLPSGGADPVAMQQLPERVVSALLVDWVSLLGAAPFARRAFATANALSTAASLSGIGATLTPLPSLEKPAG